MGIKKENICYESDSSRMAGKIERVIVPKTLLEVQAILRSSNIDIVPRGSGTGLVGGAVPNSSIVLDMSMMTKVSHFSPAKKVCHVEPGVTLKELNEKLEPFFLEFPIDPANKGISTIGGMIATNCSGDRSMRYGTIKDWIEEIEYVDGRGELAKTSKADLNDICGMEGTTGIIVGATIKLSPKIKRSASAFQTNDLDELLSIVRRLRSEKEVVILELFSPLVSKMVGLPEKYNLLIEFNSERGKIKGPEYEDITKIRENIYFSMYKEGYYNSEDPKLFFDKIKEFLIYLDDNRIPYIAHLGAGIIIPFFKDNEKNKREGVIGLIKKVKATPGKYGVGLTRKGLVDSFQSKIIQRVKVRHDPYQRLNDGKVVEIIDAYIPKRYRGKAINQDTGNKADIETEDNPNDISIKDVIKEIKVEEKQVKDLIKEAKQDELKIEEEKLKDLVTNEPIEKPVQEDRSVIKDFPDTAQLIKDYQNTYNSELTKEKTHAVEEIAKNIPKDIAKKEIQREPVIIPKEKVVVDYKRIQDLMTGKSGGFSSGTALSTDKARDSEGPGKVIVTDNLDKKTDKSKADIDLINKIMYGDKESKK